MRTGSCTSRMFCLASPPDIQGVSQLTYSHRYSGENTFGFEELA
jgi:hypothetical protein